MDRIDKTKSPPHDVEMTGNTRANHAGDHRLASDAREPLTVQHSPAEGMSRRDVLRAAAVGSLVMLGSSSSEVRGMDAIGATSFDASKPVKLKHVVGSGLGAVTFGVPWPRGAIKDSTQFHVRVEGEPRTTQTWVTARWPDGSVKWTAHALPERSVEPSKRLELVPGDSTGPAVVDAITAREVDGGIEIETGPMRVRFGKIGSTRLIEDWTMGQTRCDGVELVGRFDDAATDGRVESMQSRVQDVKLEQSGPVRAVVCVRGVHLTRAGRGALPFVARFYVTAGSGAIRLVHSFIFDLDEQKEFLSGLGVRAGVVMKDATYDRHVRIAGARFDDAHAPSNDAGGHQNIATSNDGATRSSHRVAGIFGEAIQGVTGLRRDPGREVREAQIRGERLPAIESWPGTVRDRMKYVPKWGDYTLVQPTADGFEIRKRTAEGFGWIRSTAGGRALGTVYLGGASGGISMGIRHFWQKYPKQLDVRDAAGDRATVTAWLYSPDVPAMDLRFYHDGMGMNDHPAELEGLNITYEDYEKDFGTPYGVANTHELTLAMHASTPSHEAMSKLAIETEDPTFICAEPTHMAMTRVFGPIWTAMESDAAAQMSAARRTIETHHRFVLDQYRTEVEQHRWYGFWDFGDVMHSYDSDRHMWRYDVGGFAWANSELSPDLWLWYSFLRTGDGDLYRLAEAMTRHTSEVDIYHAGKYKGLGTRHNVQHWGCSCKQLRISTAVYRRFYYYLTADERVGDLLRDQIDSDQTAMVLDLARKIRTDVYVPRPEALGIGFGTDWTALAAAWLTEIERTGDARCLMKLKNGMRTIGEQPVGLFSRGAMYNMHDGTYSIAPDRSIGISHLSSVFGQLEIYSELIDLYGDEKFEAAFVQYCRLYNAPGEEQRAELGQALRGNSLTQNYSRLTAYAAWRLKDPKLAARAWSEFWAGETATRLAERSQSTRIDPPAVHQPIEYGRVGTNGASQWGLAAIQCLALIGEQLEANTAS